MRERKSQPANRKRGETTMKKNTIKMPINYKNLFTLEDMEAIHDFIKNNEDSVITDAVSILENALAGETLKYDKIAIQ